VFDPAPAGPLRAAFGRVLPWQAWTAAGSRCFSGPFRPDFRAVIEADDGAVIMVEWHGYGRAYPPERRQIVGSVFHLADREPHRRLNDAVCVCAGEVRASGDPGQAGPDLVIDVAELIWEPIAG
jgi:hypothetical protein